MQTAQELDREIAEAKQHGLCVICCGTGYTMNYAETLKFPCAECDGVGTQAAVDASFRREMHEWHLSGHQ